MSSAYDNPKWCWADNEIGEIFDRTLDLHEMAESLLSHGAPAAAKMTMDLDAYVELCRLHVEARAKLLKDVWYVVYKHNQGKLGPEAVAEAERKLLRSFADRGVLCRSSSESKTS